ncbi:MAG: glycoside hydrolase family 30 beta sandwich domain-containing protein [Fidelibacterota bacterium]
MIKFVKLIAFPLLIIPFIVLSCKSNSASPDTEAPAIQLTYAEEYTYSFASGMVPITAVVTDNEAVDRVEFFIVGEDISDLIETDYSIPFELNWNTANYDNCSTWLIYAIAYDESGNSEQSNFHTFNVDNSTESETEVQLWLTEGMGSAHLEQKPNRFFKTSSCGSANLIEVHPDQIFQQIDGFGAALTHSSAMLINNSPNRELIIQKLFSKDEGIGISYIRLAIGASDFVQCPHFSYDDVDGDTDLSEFSIDPDRDDLLPVLQDILLINPELKIVASPWSAPGWMKTSGSMIGGELLPQYYNAYANYFLKYIQAYQAEGILIDAVTIQNEPGYVPGDYPGMYMNSSMQASFIRDYLGPVLTQNGIDTKILVFDHNWGWDPDLTSGADFVLDIYIDPEAAQYIDGSAWHGYGGDVIAQSLVHNAYPDKNIYFTERTNSTIWENWDGVPGHITKYYFMDVLNNWSKNVLLWNLVLDPDNEPHCGGCDNCTGLITADGSQLSYEVDYYITGHFSKFVETGANKIGVSQSLSGVESVAFQNPDGSKIVIVVNTGYDRRSFYLVQDDLSLYYSLAGQALATFIW